MAHMRSYKVEFLGSFPKSVPAATLPEVAFVGRSNVGKSSAINAMLGRKKKVARVSGRPGRTQAVNLFHIDERVCFADLPGYGFARVPHAVRDAWKQLVEGYLFEREGLNLVVVLVDARHDAQKMDIQMIDVLRQARRNFVVLATKVDRMKRSKRAGALASLRKGLGLKGDQIIPFSSPDRVGVDEAWAAIEAAI
jgi:GTP-binding protein